MAEMDREEIKRRLLALNDPWLSVAFAARVVADALPGLSEGAEEGKFGLPSYKPFLWFWKEKKRTDYLLKVLRAWQCTWIAAHSRDRETSTAYSAARAAADAADKTNSAANAAYTTAYAAARATYAAAAAARATRATYYNTTYDAAVDVTAVNVANCVIILDKMQDFKVFFLAPTLQIPPTFSSHHQRFLDHLCSVGEGFDYWADWYAARLRGEPLDLDLERQSCLLSEEILAKSPAEINAYLKSLRDSPTTAPLNRVRAIFIGFGAAGKTSLIRVLQQQPVVEGKEPMTPGVDIHDWPLPESDIQAHLWDFGGQVMAHATHQFFLRSRCLYVLVLDGRTEINANEQAEYWLEHVRAFGGDAPVLLVGNKADQARVNLDMRYLRDKYPENVVDFYPLSCTRCTDEAYRLEFQRFHRDFIAQLQAVGTHQILFTPPHFTVLEQIRQRSSTETFLPKQAFTELCGKQNIAEHGGLDQDWLLDLLDKLGVIIHFPKLPWLDSYLLNPRWLTYGVYTLLYAEQTRQQQGRLQTQSVIEILRAKAMRDNQGHALHYAPEHCRFILDALEQFEIGFRLPDQSLLIPALLPSDTPEHGFIFSNALAFDFDFSGFLPRHVLPGFVVRRHEEIVDNHVWQNGVRLKSPNLDAEALAQADYHERRLSLWVRGSQAGRYFAVLHDDILRMLARMEDLPFEEFVHLPKSAQLQAPRRPVSAHLKPRADFRDLLAKEAAGERRFTGKFGTYDLAKVLQILPPEAREIPTGDCFDFSGATIHDANLTLKADLERVTQRVGKAPKPE